MNNNRSAVLAPQLASLPCCDADRASQSTWACFNEAHTHRYSLGRRWDHSKPMLVCLLLNPSYADKYILDRTLTRVQGFAHDWGYGGFECVNAFSFKSTDPRALVAGDPSDYERLRNEATDNHIKRAVANAAIIMVGWSSHLSRRQLSFRVPELLALIGDQPIYAWKINASGQPAHPLYLLKTLKPILFHLAVPATIEPLNKPLDSDLVSRKKTRLVKRKANKPLSTTKRSPSSKRVLDAKTSDALRR